MAGTAFSVTAVGDSFNKLDQHILTRFNHFELVNQKDGSPVRFHKIIDVKLFDVQARGMLVQAINIFSDIAERRPNKESITGYILAMIEAKYVNKFNL